MVKYNFFIEFQLLYHAHAFAGGQHKEKIAKVQLRAAAFYRSIQFASSGQRVPQ
ncbi:hypothetical protein pRL110497 (plasmid) [Rhizobium johnstonii 3841]|uniref:Uncharacterized protein n=1 Tax=Rhizobium johnstonii (strain DSM 114642 / LMG 32736 / 3841) TaxID=216596 RepID=Q1M5N9_RHIJ3|nr:hypothetical protein pRL110497 [Rhizobium johnstonii 3841]